MRFSTQLQAPAATRLGASVRTQVAVRIETVFPRSFDQAEQHRTAPGSAGCVGKEEILPEDHKGLDAPLRPIVAEFNAAILQVCVQFGSLVLQIV